MIRPFFVIFIGIVSGEIVMNITGRQEIMSAVILAGGGLLLLAVRFFRKKSLTFLLFYAAFLGGAFLFFQAGKEERNAEQDLLLQCGELSGKVTQIRTAGEEEGLKITIKEARGYSAGEKWVLKKKCMVFLDREGKTEIFPGDQIRVKGTLALPKRASNPGEFDQENYYRASGIYYLFYGDSLSTIIRPSFSVGRMAYMLKKRIHKVYGSFFTGEQTALLYAMVLGDKSELSEEQKKLYEESGTAHLLAVSGLHISMVGGRIYRFLRKRKRSYLFSCFAGMSALLFYGCVVGSGSSATRALLMFAVFLGAELFGMNYDILSSMSFSGILMLIQYPYRILEGGFLISFSSIIAIGTAVPFTQKILENETEGFFCGDHLGGKIIRHFVAGAMITVTILPMTLRIFYEFSPYSIFLNLIMIPAMTLLMPFAIAGGVAGILIAGAGYLLLVPVKLILMVFEGILSVTDRLPGSPIVTGCPGASFLIFFYFLEVIVLFLWYHKKWSIMMMLPAAIFAAVMFMPGAKLKVVMLDVGQGDGILLCLPDHTGVLIDGGSSSKSEVGKYVIEPALKYYGIGSLDYGVITHFDQDHYSGILELMEEGYPMKNLLLQEWNLKESEEDVVKEVVGLAKKNHTSVSYLGKGDRIRFEDGEMICCHPYKELDAQDKNDASIVLYFRYLNFSMLFTGDLGSGQEEKITNVCKEKKLTVLKVAHHGSKNSTCRDFLEKMNPAFSWISAGENNRYGHPHGELLERLSQTGTKVFRTDQGGAILAVTDGEKLVIDYWKNMNHRLLENN